MNSKLKRLFLFIGFMIFSSIINTQNYYIRLDDASGWNADSYQPSLEQAAYDLVQIFPSEIQDSFRVFDFISIIW